MDLSVSGSELCQGSMAEGDRGARELRVFARN